MKSLIPSLVGVLALSACAATPPAQTAASAPVPPPAPMVHTMVAAKDLKWGPAPGILPPGAQAAVVFGDPGKASEFAIRLRFPKGYQVPPHSHTAMESVTVISGALRIGMGDVADRAKAHLLTAGGVAALPGMSPHYAIADADTVLQVNATGPFDIKYVNPAQDPRNKK